MEGLYALARKAGLLTVPPRPEPFDRRRCILEGGYYIHPDTGMLLGRHSI